MTTKELLLAVDSLENLENEINTDDFLHKMFDKCLYLFDLIEASSLSSSSEEYQNHLCKCIKNLEKCTIMVNELDLFSSNESIDEVQTSSIRYLLLPALLGSLNLVIQNKEIRKRLENIEIAEVYFRDFLLRCKNYELCKGKYFEDSEDIMKSDVEAEKGKDMLSSSDLASKRENKIQQYKLRKQLKKQEEALKSSLERSDADEYVREYYLVLLEKWILTALEELENIKREKSILKNMIQQKKDVSETEAKEKNLDRVQPLKPIIITKNEIQKKVFGMGYPSLPVLTIEDFYRQRFEKYIQEQKLSSGKDLNERTCADISSKEREEIEKEVLIEKDDQAALKKAREWDEWKDDNPRGSGNRKNKG